MNRPAREHRPDRAASGERRPGRPRDVTADGAILEATLELIGEEGYTGLSMDAVAARSGVGKTTIYRRWPSKQELVIAAAKELSQSVPLPDTGAVRDDLELIARGLATVFAGTSSARLVASLLAEATRDPALAEALRGGFLAVRREAARVALERGVARGELRSGMDLDFAVDQLAAPFYYRMLVTGGPIDSRFSQAVVDAVLTVYAVAPDRGTGRSDGQGAAPTHD